MFSQQQICAFLLLLPYIHSTNTIFVVLIKLYTFAVCGMRGGMMLGRVMLKGGNATVNMIVKVYVQVQ